MNSKDIDDMTEHDLLKAIIDSMNDEEVEDNAMTMEEIREKFSLTDKKARRAIKGLMTSGKVEVIYVQRETLTTPLTGRLYPKPGYRLVT